MVYTPNYSHLVGIMISKTIGCRGTLFSDKLTSVWEKMGLHWFSQEQAPLLLELLEGGASPGRNDPNPNINETQRCQDGFRSGFLDPEVGRFFYLFHSISMVYLQQHVTPLFGSPHFGVFERRNGSVTGCKEYGGLNRKLKVSVRFVKAIKPCKPILKLMKLSFGNGMVSSMVMPRRVSCFFWCWFVVGHSL